MTGPPNTGGILFLNSRVGEAVEHFDPTAIEASA